MPAPIVLFETTLLLNFLSEENQGAAAASEKSGDAVESTTAGIGFVGCVAEGKTGAETIGNRLGNGNI